MMWPGLEWPAGIEAVPGATAALVETAAGRGTSTETAVAAVATAATATEGTILCHRGDSGRR